MPLRRWRQRNAYGFADVSALNLLSFHSTCALEELQEPVWVAPARLGTRRPAKSPLAAG
jgi:hypothetical protein